MYIKNILNPILRNVSTADILKSIKVLWNRNQIPSIMSNRERTIESKGRIEFIDLAKGICILLVVMIHVGVPEYIPGLYAAKVPIFFLLSGLFFLKKVNFFLRGGYWNKLCTTIVIPFLAYYLISYAMFYVIDRVIPNVLGGKQDFSIIDVFR